MRAADPPQHTSSTLTWAKVVVAGVAVFGMTWFTLVYVAPLLKGVKTGVGAVVDAGTAVVEGSVDATISSLAAVANLPANIWSVVSSLWRGPVFNPAVMVNFTPDNIAKKANHAIISAGGAMRGTNRVVAMTIAAWAMLLWASLGKREATPAEVTAFLAKLHAPKAAPAIAASLRYAAGKIDNPGSTSATNLYWVINDLIRLNGYNHDVHTSILWTAGTMITQMWPTWFPGISVTLSPKKPWSGYAF